MKKRIIAMISVLVLCLSMQSFALAKSETINITNAAAYKADNLSGNNLYFASLNSETEYIMPESVLTSFQYDQSIMYYTFTADGILAKTKKDNFYSSYLKSVSFKISQKGLKVTYTYKDNSKKVVTDTTEPVNFVYYNNIGKRNVAAFSSLAPKKIIPTKAYLNQIAFQTRLLGDITLSLIEMNDVKDKKAWYYQSVNDACARGIVSGDENFNFAPLRSVTRAELATLIVEATKDFIYYRKDSSLKFTDVKDDAWYAEYVNKCAATGLMSGVGDGRFNPNATATRQEIALLTANLLKLVGSYKGNPLPKIDTSRLDAALEAAYTDSEKVDSWAKEGVLFCYRLGVMQGADRMFSPKRAITRAESATLFLDLNQSI